MQILIPRLRTTMGSSLSTRAVASSRARATDAAISSNAATTAAGAAGIETMGGERETSTSKTAAAPPPPLTPPREPGPEDCCQSGCQECVWEVYYRERRAYEKALAERESGGGSVGGDAAAPAAAAAPSSAAAVAMDAFAALEAKLAEQEAERNKRKEAENAS